MPTAHTPAEMNLFEFLRDCGFHVEDTGDWVGFDLQNMRGGAPNFLLQYRSQSFHLLFPYRYPLYAKLSRGLDEITWEMTLAEIRQVYATITEHVLELGGAQQDVARYLHCYIMCPRDQDNDFSDVLVCYTDAELLHIGQSTRNLDVDTLTELLQHKVPAAELIKYEPKTPLSLFLDLYPTNLYDHTRV